MNKVWLIGQLADRKGKRVDPTALAICHNNHHKINKKGDVALTTSPDNKNLATTYSPTYYRSTISAGGLNFSVRKGKRWTPPL